MSGARSWMPGQSFGSRYRFYAMIWLVYLIYPLLTLFQIHSSLKVVVGALAIAAFVWTYAKAFALRPPADSATLWLGAAIEAIGLVMAAYIGPAFLGIAVYASVALARLRSGRAHFVAGTLGIGLLVLVGLLVRTPSDEVLSLALVSALSSIALRGMFAFFESTAQLRRAHAEIAELAALEERHRIARDMHDIVGHSLSLVVLKSELTRALLERSDIGDALQEVGELESVARGALAEVRQAVSGYRKPVLKAELLRAPSTLAAAGIRCELEGESEGLSRSQEEAMAFILREAITNVVRHSAARHCRIAFARDADGGVRITVQDDGRAGERISPGNGLQGMAERVRAAGGQIVWRGGAGFALEVHVPSSAE